MLSRPNRPALVQAAALASAFLLVGGVTNSGARYDLTHTVQPGVFAGTWLEIVAIAVALVTGVAAVAGGRKRLAFVSVMSER